MPPKKVVKEEKALLGRPSNNLKIGVVGLPNVGKSTFFNAITNSAVAAENYPFCTIEPEEARVAVPDERFDWLVEHFKPKGNIPAFLTVIDIAGLVKGASAGAGLGNNFLSHIRSVDAIFHVVRAFSDPDVIHVEGELDPVRDLEIIHQELRLKDIELLKKYIDTGEKALQRVGTGGNAADREKREEIAALKKVLEWLESGKDVRKGDWTNKEIEFINQQNFITAKTVIYLANLSEKDFARKKNKYLPKIKAWIDENNQGDMLIPFSGCLEQALSLMDPKSREEHLASLQTTSALAKIIVSGYSGLRLDYFFTCGPDEVRAWTIRKGTKAPQAAGVIHSDFERGFIMAEVYNYNDIRELGSEAAVKSAGKYLQKGRDYVVSPGDIIFFKFNVTADKKKR
ncbi:Obg-like ATPase 1 [Zancudomyces culisetae]|uniref:Obg-like ATPase 1 n=1 Tax=Zancudomyces culisetae TaxID=1213189 RepID=A0A1R1PUN0_ZANCU|nr:Obg-like ATPase 1 [Zancudomyces culisetae]|eukprot:OMH84623.1 Obg-like ATPase 1 [Zancudomyces culisetae]